MPKITFDGVEKRFGSVKVLAPFNLTLSDGEFTVLVGPSGCGKSTTLRMLAGLESISGGEIYFDGKPIAGLAPKNRDIAMVFQDYALYPHMNVAQNMSFSMRLARRSKAEIAEKVQRVASMLSIAHLLQRKPGELSGGQRQRQRVAMGRALVRDASTFLFDEPLSNLDAKLRAKMRIELAEMSQAIRKNMVYVTHDQVEAMTLGDRIVVMSEGAIQQQGTPEDLYRRPVNRFVAGFIGSPPMNFIDATIVEESGQLIARGSGFSIALGKAVATRLRAVGARDVDLGVRPSAFVLDSSSKANFELQVKVSEYLGSTSVVAARCGNSDVLAELPSAKSFGPGARVSMYANPDDVMIFDSKSGVAI